MKSLEHKAKHDQLWFLSLQISEATITGASGITENIQNIYQITSNSDPLFQLLLA